MNVRDQITAEMKTAMKTKQTERLATLRMIKAEIIKKETEKNAVEVDEAGLMRLLQTMKKQREESISQFEKGGRTDLADKERAEIAVLETFLPKQLDDAALQALAAEVVAELGITEMKQMGGAVKEVMARAAGGADGKRISAAVKACLN